MKTPQYRIAKLLGALSLGALLMHPLRLAAQENDNRQPEPRQRDSDKDASMAKRFQPIMREIDDLLEAGKFDEVLQRVEKIRDIAKENPRVMALIQRAIGERKAKPDAKPHPSGGPGDADSSPRARIQHLHAAAAQLDAAGCPRLADQTRAEISNIEADAKRQEAKRRELMRQEAERNKAERQQAESPRDGGPDANTAMKSELGKLHREIEDLRNQLRHLKADAAPKQAPMPPPVPPPGPMPPGVRAQP